MTSTNGVNYTYAIGWLTSEENAVNEQAIISVDKLLRGIIVSAESMRGTPNPDLEELEAMESCVKRIINLAREAKTRNETK